MAWEYQIVLTSKKPDNVTRILNDAGLLGWEVCTSDYTSSLQSNVFIMKRKLSWWKAFWG